MLVKQLRYYTRFITVCLLLGKRDEVWEHLQKLTELVEEFSKEAQVGNSLVPRACPEPKYRISVNAVLMKCQICIKFEFRRRGS